MTCALCPEYTFCTLRYQRDAIFKMDGKFIICVPQMEQKLHNTAYYTFCRYEALV